MASRSIGRMVLLLSVVVPGAVRAQVPTAPKQLTLPQALQLAQGNNPGYQQTLRNTIGADDDVRAAYAGFVPTVSSSASFGYSGGGSTPVAGTVFQESARMSSSYSVSVGLGLSADRFLAPGQAKARRELVDENIGVAKSSMLSDVTLQYISALRASAGVNVALQQVARSRDFFNLAEARVRVGSGNGLDAKSAEVDLNRAEVQVLRVRQSETEAKIQLLNRIGLPVGTDVDSLRLAEAFPLAEVVLDLPALRQSAREHNPTMRAAEAQEEVSRLSLKTAKLSYLPTFSIGTGINGSSQASTNTDQLLALRYANAQGSVNGCELQNALYSRLTSPLPLPNGGIVANCFVAAGLTADGSALSPDVAAAVRESNSGFPFNYRRGPLGVSMSLSLPIWDGFQRANRISAARVAQANDRDNLRARELEIDGQIVARSTAVRTAWETIRLNDLARANAAQQLQLAQARYSGGSATALDVQTAQNAVTQAEYDYVSAVYDYHTAVVSLETLVGRPLR